MMDKIYLLIIHYGLSKMTPHHEAAVKAGFPLFHDRDAIEEYKTRPAAEFYFVSSFWGQGDTYFPSGMLGDEFPPLKRASLHYTEGCGDPLIDPAAYWAKRAGDFGGFVCLMTPNPRPYQRFALAGLAGNGINILSFYPGADEVTPYLLGAAEAGVHKTLHGRFDRPWNPSRAIGRELPDPWESAYDRMQRDRRKREEEAAAQQRADEPSMLTILAGAALETVRLRIR